MWVNDTGQGKTKLTESALIIYAPPPTSGYIKGMTNQISPTVSHMMKQKVLE